MTREPGLSAPTLTLDRPSAAISSTQRVRKADMVNKRDEGMMKKRSRWDGRAA